jgi:hypothetical protein
MILGLMIAAVLCFMVGFLVGRAETMETDVVYIKERLYRFIKHKCYTSETGEVNYCSNRYIIDFKGDLYLQTKGGYKKCISQK